MKNKVKIITYDLEVSYVLSATWGLFKQNVSKVIRQPYILSCSYKELGKKVKFISLKDFPLYKKDRHNDRDLVKFIRDNIFDKADIKIAHNGKGFDDKWVLGRIAVHGFTPPSPSKTIDTLLIARNKFRLTSNRLNDLGQLFGLGVKEDTGGIDLWYDICDGKDEKKRKKAWKVMKKYNNQDVNLLEKIYLHMLPYITNHPNLALMNGERSACPNCGSTNVERRGYRYTRASKFYRWSCNDCGSWHSSLAKEDSQIR